MTIEQIAKLCHETNRIYCCLIGDDSQIPWHVAPDWQKNSAISGVRFHIENKEATPCDSHNEWLRVKLADGWKCGRVKDVEKKEHPCCVPYEDLPEEQKVKDSLFMSIVAVMTPLLNAEDN